MLQMTKQNNQFVTQLISLKLQEHQLRLLDLLIAAVTIKLRLIYKNCN